MNAATFLLHCKDDILIMAKLKQYTRYGLVFFVFVFKCLQQKTFKFFSHFEFLGVLLCP